MKAQRISTKWFAQFVSFYLEGRITCNSHVISAHFSHLACTKTSIYELPIPSLYTYTYTNTFTTKCNIFFSFSCYCPSRRKQEEGSKAHGSNVIGSTPSITSFVFAKKRREENHADYFYFMRTITFTFTSTSSHDPFFLSLLVTAVTQEEKQGVEAF